MRVLIICSQIPMPDRASGDLRFYTFLKLIAELHEVTLCPFNLEKQNKEMGEAITKGYIEQIETINVHLGATDVLTTLRNEQFDLIIFEFYHSVQRYIDFVRYFQPTARILIDSVDIHYNRLLSKAALTGKPSDFEYAKTVKQLELSAYRQADLIIAVTEDDGLLLKKDATNTKIGLLPNIHHIPEFIPVPPPYTKLLFVGSFKHEPNVDAILYFCDEIFPLLLEMNSNFTLEVIGPNPPESVQALQSDKIFIRGFIENLDECYRKTHISIAPLRFGAGMKGKIGEALSFGIPVVTTRIGAEGFGLSVGVNILVAETSLDFAESILRLSQDNQLYKKLSTNGYNFIKDNYSEEATRTKLTELFNRALAISPKRLVTLIKIKLWLQVTYNRYIGWRFKHV
jgi:glycosyltransferase involved in cell wall biosynthesis